MSCRCICLTVMAVIAALVIAGAVAFQLLASSFAYPWHASCKITWTMEVPCDTFRERLVGQIDAWKGTDCPMASEQCPSMPCGQNCKYKLVSDSATSVVAEHRTPVADYMDRLTFDFPADGENTDMCTVHAFSTSDTWYAILDFGTNYCNLRNLIDGAGLSSADGFAETTNTTVCTQLDKIDCERF